MKSAFKESNEINIEVLFYSILTGKQKYEKDLEYLKKNTNSKSVCAKALSGKTVAWKCETCEKDPTCIICQDCFDKSNHEGHKV